MRENLISVNGSFLSMIFHSIFPFYYLKIARRKKKEEKPFKFGYFDQQAEGKVRSNLSLTSGLSVRPEVNV